jgi:hypothetical protein
MSAPHQTTGTIWGLTQYWLYPEHRPNSPLLGIGTIYQIPEQNLPYLLQMVSVQLIYQLTSSRYGCLGRTYTKMLFSEQRGNGEAGFRFWLVALDLLCLR